MCIAGVFAIKSVLAKPGTNSASKGCMRQAVGAGLHGQCRQADAGGWALHNAAHSAPLQMRVRASKAATSLPVNEIIEGDHNTGSYQLLADSACLHQIADSQGEADG